MRNLKAFADYTVQTLLIRTFHHVSCNCDCNDWTAQAQTNTDVANIFKINVKEVLRYSITEGERFSRLAA